MSDAPQGAAPEKEAARASADLPLVPAQAWQPFTPRGVAAFGAATLSRLLWVELIVALIVAVTCVWAAANLWFPVVEDAIRALPPDTVIVNGKLITGAPGSLRLAGNNALEIKVDGRAQPVTTGTADIVAVLGETGVRACGLFGCAFFPYSPDYAVTLSREQAEPWWGAWRKVIATGIAAATVIGLFAAWWVLGTVTAPIVKLIAFYNDRAVTLRASWRIANAALMPGAMIVAVGVFLYAVGAIDLLRLILCYAVHIVCGVIFIVTAPFFLPRIPKQSAGNPFASGEKSEGSAGKKKGGGENPFAPR